MFNSIQESSDASEDKRELLAAELTLDTSLLSGLLTTIFLEEPTHPNGSNLICDYLAARTVIVNGQTRDLSIRHPNGISKLSNATLRLLRHGLSSLKSA